jgi:hypothetical protein
MSFQDQAWHTRETTRRRRTLRTPSWNTVADRCHRQRLFDFGCARARPGSGDSETRGVEEDTRACVRMALAMQKRVRELAELWRDMGIETPLRCRIGIHGRARTLLALMDAILDPRSGTVSTSAPGMGSSGGAGSRIVNKPRPRFGARATVPC